MKLSNPNVEKWLVVLISLHSIGVGITLFFWPAWSVQFGGWDVPDLLFFIRQSGIFHFVLAVGYLTEYFKYKGITLLVTAKTTALVFLIGMTLWSTVPWAVPLLGVADGMMGFVVLFVHRRLRST
jgi:hypothetical protein